MKRRITTQEIVDKQDEIITKNLYDFKDWFEQVDDDMQDLMQGFFTKGDKRNVIINQVLRKKKINKLNDNIL